MLLANVTQNRKHITAETNSDITYCGHYKAIFRGLWREIGKIRLKNL
jgi:hypothetical protein